ncbi:Serine hydrolase/GTPase-like protein [Novymonas esmeraldas]|uniref:Serine hydrolase/GTPase-like protein n=1 Tax=Novymonas esmeraldas TaxID=1808958 RepID=A0AAW0F003_9TRYP
MTVRVLCLHGAQQTREIFQNQLSRFQDDLANLAELVFVEAPHVLPLITAEDDTPTRSWCADGDAESYSAGDAVVAAAMQPDGPGTDLACTVMLGFSQGALMIYRFLRRRASDAAVAAQLRGVIVAGAPDPRRVFSGGDAVAGLFPPPADSAAGVFGQLAFLHIIGRKDAIVQPEESAAFAQVCSTASRILFHDHAHSIPALKEVRTAVREVCRAASMSSAEVAAAQEARDEELEMVQSMYEDCLVTRGSAALVRLPLFPDVESTLAAVSSSSTATAAAAASLEAAGVRVLERLKVCFRVPWSYPSTLPVVEVVDGPSWHSVSYERWAADVVVRTSAYLADELGVGTAMLLPAYLYATGLAQETADVVVDAIARGGSGGATAARAAGAEEESAAATLAGLWADEDDALRTALITEAETKAAAALLAEARRSGDGGGDEDGGDEDAHNGAPDADAAGAVASSSSSGSGSGGGSCTLTIGLIGKPSAGKSTFFNAVTNPTDESDAARVAAFPFTTIEPNIGAGLAPLYCPCATLGDGAGHAYRLAADACDATYGHVRALGDSRFRLHPVKVKDVAGLVQGAYQGKGKGNQFLNDLCDADVLVHVVDGAAATEADGTACAPGHGSALEDISWVRAEVHSWIYDNLRAKWTSLVRQPAKLRIMFSGYRSTPTFVDRVLRRVGIANELALAAKLRTWGPSELHLFVALYIRLRFPMVVALNKADLPSAGDVAAKLRDAYPHEVFVPMTARTEWLALQMHRRGHVVYTPGATSIELKIGEAEVAALDKDTRRDVHDVVTFFRRTADPTASAARQPPSSPLLSTTGVQDVLATAMEACGTVLVYPVRAFNPVPSLAHCLTFKQGSSAERVFNAMTHLRLLEGKLVRFEVVDLTSAKLRMLHQLVTALPTAANGASPSTAEKPPHDSHAAAASTTVRTLRKTEVIGSAVVLARVLSNKRQLA